MGVCWLARRVVPTNMGNVGLGERLEGNGYMRRGEEISMGK